MKKNAKAGNFSLIAVLAFMVVMSVAVEALGDSVFLFAVGYTATYSVTYPDGTAGTATLQITGTENINGTQWMIAELSNWDVSGGHTSMDIRCTSDTLYRLLTYGAIPTFEELPAGSSWDYINEKDNQETATIVSIGPLTVAAGTLANVYRVHYYDPKWDIFYPHDEDMYWAPGVGLVKDVDKGSDGTRTMELTSVVQTESPDKGTIGTEMAITGVGFGTTKGKVLIGNIAPKILEWTDSSIQCQLVKSPPLGTYDVTIQPKSASPIVMESGFTITAPEIDSVKPSSGSANEQITVTGFYFGTKKGKVLLEGKNCKVASWMMAPSTGESEIQFIVPKGISSGVHEMQVITGVGSGTVNFTVE